MAKKFLQPSSAGLRNPTDTNMVNGQIINTPRYAQMGGLTSPKKLYAPNSLKVVKPGGTVK